ncbi:MAG: hypothetical protein GF353_26135 [Candidatus Lokiarchaeota archaeon]|nr:hypothetical protein [Candidatus Lokiarchaeota archaeon]
MIEVSLEDFEEVYNGRLDELFYKVKRGISKILSDIQDEIINIKLCMDHFAEAEGRVDEKAKRSLNLFIDRVKSYTDEIDIPKDHFDYEILNDLSNSIKKLFRSINSIAKKSLPKFQKETQSEIKELNYITRKLGKRQAILDKYLRKKYTELKNAEDILNKIPKFFNLKENIENSKKDLIEYENNLEEIKEELERFNKELLKIGKNELFEQLKEKKDDLFRLKIRINDDLGFKKALKKLKFELERGDFQIANFDLNYLNKFLKKPIKILGKERKDLPKFTAMLVHLRHTLEDSNVLNLKSETKEKTIEQINQIFEQKIVEEKIKTLNSLKSEIKELEKKISEKGLAEKYEDLKNQISTYTIKLEHAENDFNRRNKDYLRYLATLKKEREEFQNQVKDIIQEDVKVNISFEF